jgi:recombination protein RecT
MTDVRDSIAVQNTRKPTVASMVTQLTPEIQRALPKHMDGDRIARLALTAIRKDKNLGQCSPESFAGALLTAAAMGLEPNVHGEAYLVPYKGECTLIVGYQGYAKLFYQSPIAKHLDAQTVYANDDFSYEYGLNPSLTHKPAQGDRGAIVAYYAVATLTTGASSFVVLSPEEVRALRGGKVGTSGRIPDPMHWMERKTVLRQLFKTMPRSADLNRAIDTDERDGSELHRELVQERQIETPTPTAITGPVEPDADGVYPAEVVDENPQWTGAGA